MAHCVKVCMDPAHVRTCMNYCTNKSMFWAVHVVCMLLNPRGHMVIPSLALFNSIKEICFDVSCVAYRNPTHIKTAGYQSWISLSHNVQSSLVVILYNLASGYIWYNIVRMYNYGYRSGPWSMNIINKCLLDLRPNIWYSMKVVKVGLTGPLEQIHARILIIPAILNALNFVHWDSWDRHLVLFYTAQLYRVYFASHDPD